VDVNAILKTLYFGHGTRLATVVDKGALGYDPSVQPYPYDSEQGQGAAGRGRLPPTASSRLRQLHRQHRRSFQAGRGDRGLPAKGRIQGEGQRLRVLHFGPRRVQNQTAPLFIYSIGDAYLEPSWVIRWLTQGGLGMHYKNPKLDEMLTKIEATDDPKKRAPQYSDVQKLLKEEAPFHLSLSGRRAFGMSARVDYTPRADETQWLYPMTLKG